MAVWLQPASAQTPSPAVVPSAQASPNATCPRLPFEPIDHATYLRLNAEVASRRSTTCFFEALQRYDRGELVEAGPAGCDSDKCLLPLAKPAN